MSKIGTCPRCGEPRVGKHACPTPEQSTLSKLIQERALLDQAAQLPHAAQLGLGGAISIVGGAAGGGFGSAGGNISFAAGHLGQSKRDLEMLQAKATGLLPLGFAADPVHPRTPDAQRIDWGGAPFDPKSFGKVAWDLFVEGDLPEWDEMIANVDGGETWVITCPWGTVTSEAVPYIPPGTAWLTMGKKMVCEVFNIGKPDYRREHPRMPAEAFTPPEPETLEQDSHPIRDFLAVLGTVATFASMAWQLYRYFAS